MAKNNFLKNLKDSLIKDTEDSKPVAEQVVIVKEEPTIEEVTPIDYPSAAFSIVRDEEEDILKLYRIEFNHKENKVSPELKLVSSMYSRDEINSLFKIQVAMAGILGE